MPVCGTCFIYFISHLLADFCNYTFHFFYKTRTVIIKQCSEFQCPLIFSVLRDVFFLQLGSKLAICNCKTLLCATASCTFTT